MASPIYVGEVDRYPNAQETPSSIKRPSGRIQVADDINFGLCEVARSLKCKARSIVVLRMVQQ